MQIPLRQRSIGSFTSMLSFRLTAAPEVVPQPAGGAAGDLLLRDRGTAIGCGELGSAVVSGGKQMSKSTWHGRYPAAQAQTVDCDSSLINIEATDDSSSMNWGSFPEPNVMQFGDTCSHSGAAKLHFSTALACSRRLADGAAV